MGKKSYMNRKNLITEGFFSKLASLLGLSSSQVKKDFQASKRMRKQVSVLNNAVDDLEQELEKAYGMKVDLKKFTAADFK